MRFANGTEFKNDDGDAVPLDIMQRFQSRQMGDDQYIGWDRGGYDNNNLGGSPFSAVTDTNAIIVRKWGHMRAKFKACIIH